MEMNLNIILETSVYHVLLGLSEPSSVLKKANSNYDILPANRDLIGAEIELTDEMGMIMQYPTLDSFTDSTTVINASNMLDVIASCVAQIYDKKGEDVYDAKDSTKQELVDFLESLNSKQFLEIQKFFDTMPKLAHTVTIENPETKVKSDITLTGLNDFFV